MAPSDPFVLHRPELTDALLRGDAKLRAAMAANNRTVAAGETIVEQENEHPFVYRVRSGWAGRVRHLADGRRQLILLFLPDDLFGVKSLFLVSHGDAIEALTELTVDYVHHEELRALYMGDPEVALRCNWQVVEEERRLHNWIVGLGQGSADERLALVLLEWHGRLVRAGQIADKDDGYALPMTQAALGDHLGLTAVHVNRVLKRFRDDGLVLIKGGQVRLLDPSALRRIAFHLQDDYERTEAEQATR